MTDQPLEWLKEQPAGLALLAAYARHEADCPRRPRPAESADPPVDAAADSDPEFEADASHWIPRLTAVENVDPASLPSLHGRLIALGLLKFELFGRTGGMRYRLSTAGRQTLATATETHSIETPTELPAAA
jgi:hypothetical protein